MTAQKKDSVLFLILGLLVFTLIANIVYIIPEQKLEQAESIASLPKNYNTIVWKLRKAYKEGEKITVSAKHRFPGHKGALKYVVYYGNSENFRPPEKDVLSRTYTVANAGDYSEFSFHAKKATVFVGLSWKQKTPPILLEKDQWDNPVFIENYAYAGDINKLKEKFVPIKADFKVEDRSTTTLDAGTFILIIILLTIIAGAVITRKSEWSLTNTVCFTIGMIISIRIVAMITDSTVLWSYYYIEYMPPLSLSLVLIGPILVFTAYLISKPRIESHPVSNIQFILLFVGLIVAAYFFRCTRVYGDWVYGYTNFTHAPFTSSLFHIIENQFQPGGWVRNNYFHLISIAVFVVFLFATRAFLTRVKDFSWLALLFFLSPSTLQVFFGYIEVYSIPVANWMVLIWLTKRYFDGKSSIAVPTFFSFIAYMLHVSEAMLLFTIAYLWIYDVYKNRTIRHHFFNVSILLNLCLITVAVSYYLLYLGKFDGNLAKFRESLPFYGFEILAGQHGHAGVALPLADVTKAGAHTPPGPNFAILSFDNFKNLFNFYFHYSLFFLIVPIVLLIKRKFKQLQDPLVTFNFIAFTSYLIYMSFAYVGWLPIVLDWDLFSIVALMSGTLTYLLIRQEENSNWNLLLIAGVNFSMTIPWIYMNHQNHALPW